MQECIAKSRNITSWFLKQIISCHNIVHLWRPRAENNLLPVGHKRENKPTLGALAAFWSNASSSIPSESSWSSFLWFWFSLAPLSSVSWVPTSAISPGFLSNSPLNCLRAFFSNSCLINGSQTERCEILSYL